MPSWPSCKARRVFAALLKIGWRVLRQRGSHVTLTRPPYQDYTWSYGDGDELGAKILSKIGKKTGLTPEDL